MLPIINTPIKEYLLFLSPINKYFFDFTISISTIIVTISNTNKVSALLVLYVKSEKKIIPQRCYN